MPDETVFRGRMRSGAACITDAGMIRELELKGFGEAGQDCLLLSPFEALYLLYTDRLILSRGGGNVSFESLIKTEQKADPDILTRFLIYHDLRNRGYVVKGGFGFGADFRVYERGDFGQKGARFLVFGLSEGQQERMRALQKKIIEITAMGKEPIIAVLERRGEVIYYKISRMAFRQNSSAP